MGKKQHQQKKNNITNNSNSGSSSKRNNKNNHAVPGSSSSSSKPSCPTDDLPLDEKQFLDRCTLDYATAATFTTTTNNNNNNNSCRTSQSHHDDFVQRGVEILEKEHLLIIHNALSEDDVSVLHDCYLELHQKQQQKQRAIGEKDASKRSGTRLYNCLCQLGPACDFYNWKDGTQTAKHVLHPNNNSNSNNSNNTMLDYTTKFTPKKTLWKSIADRFHFIHIARVEVVTSHVGCRAQGWHIDGVHGLTVILPLTTVGVRQGPTELDFSIPFVGIMGRRFQNQIDEC